MDLVDSHLDLSHSCLDSSQFSESSQLLESRLSAKDMEPMERDNLLMKLLQLYQALDNTEKQNQLLRIEKAQLRTQLKNTKTKAKHFIQNNIAVAQSILTTHSQHQQKLSQSPPQTSQNCFMTPYDSAEDLENNQSVNKVFIKPHKRGISNDCIVSDHESLVNPKTYCYTLMNSPTKQESIRFENSKPREKSGNKLKFPKNKLNALVAMQREYEQANEEPQNRTLENFQSFYCHKKDDLGQTQRWGSPQNYSTKPKSLAKNTTYNQQKPNNYNDQRAFYNDQKNNSSGHKIYQPFEKQRQYEEYQGQQTQRGTDKCLNRSMSSSGLSNKNYCNSRGFKIPSSIDQIWGSSKNLPNTNNNTANNKTTKLSKVNANKAGLQRKTYLNY